MIHVKNEEKVDNIEYYDNNYFSHVYVDEIDFEELS